MSDKPNPQPGMDGFDPGILPNRTNEEYNKQCREALAKSDPGSLKDKK